MAGIGKDSPLVHRQGPLIEEDDDLGDKAASIPPDRYRLVRELGHGAFGTVYEAEDRRRKARVALKILEIQDAEARYRFKREFRALARLSHPNLVTLYELHAAEEPWYFTMELVDGADFAAAGGQRAAGSGRDFDRLRTSTRQLVRAVLALHQAGMLHCDIKPSNVLVTPAGRVVVLDFGLVTDLGTSAALAERTHAMVGTPAYMSPEQCSGAPLTPASDWYAVGVVLYEALTGALPHDGHSLQILTGKCEAAPRPILEVAPDVPPDLATVCMELLDVDPAARPSGIALLRRLDRRRVKRANTASPVGHVRPDTDTGSDAAEPFVGRIHERTLLDQALARSQQGHAQVVLIGGSSGMGKTALARHYLDALARTGEILVVTGACYPREFVPYKGLDSLVDGLARALADMREDELRAVTPADIRALSRLFPVLSRLHAYAPLVELPPLQGDLRELRRRAFDTLRLLVLRLATARPVVLFIDDLQWMDAEALAWLGHVLGPPAAPPLLFIGTYERSDDAQEHPARSLLDRLGDSRGDELGERLGRRPGKRPRDSQTTPQAAPAPPAGMVIDIALGPLDAADAQEAAEALLGRRTSEETAALAASVADAASGHPFLLVQLATYVDGEPAAALRDGSGTAVTVTEAVERMLARLSPTARRLLELIAVAGRPVPQSAVADAAALKVHEVDVLAPLSTARLVRPLEIAGHDYVDVYLDCIREAVLAGLDGSHLARHHRRLAHALLRFGAPAEWLHVHFRGAGEYARAAQFAEEAGDKAALALAFERAAACYRDAIALGSQSARLHEKLGDALAHGGRGHEAADAYLTALQVSPQPRIPELRRRAAEQLLRIGHLERGLAELGTVLADVGLRLRSRWGALAYTACRRAWLYVRGLDFAPRAAKDCDPQVLLEPRRLLVGEHAPQHGRYHPGRPLPRPPPAHGPGAGRAHARGPRPGLGGGLHRRTRLPQARACARAGDPRRRHGRPARQRVPVGVLAPGRGRGRVPGQPRLAARGRDPGARRGCAARALRRRPLGARHGHGVHAQRSVLAGRVRRDRPPSSPAHGAGAGARRSLRPGRAGERVPHPGAPGRGSARRAAPAPVRVRGPARRQRLGADRMVVVRGAVRGRSLRGPRPHLRATHRGHVVALCPVARVPGAGNAHGVAVLAGARSAVRGHRGAPGHARSLAALAGATRRALPRPPGDAVDHGHGRVHPRRPGRAARRPRRGPALARQRAPGSRALAHVLARARGALLPGRAAPG